MAAASRTLASCPPAAGTSGGSAPEAGARHHLHSHGSAWHERLLGPHGDVSDVPKVIPGLHKVIPGRHDHVQPAYRVVHGVYDSPPTLYYRSEATHGQAEGVYRRAETMHVLAPRLRMLPDAARLELAVIQVRVETSPMPPRAEGVFAEARRVETGAAWQQRQVAHTGRDGPRIAPR